MYSTYYLGWRRRRHARIWSRRRVVEWKIDDRGLLSNTFTICQEL